MPWEHRARAPHRCERPWLTDTTDGTLPGSVWRCDTCSIRWRVIRRPVNASLDWERVR